MEGELPQNKWSAICMCAKRINPFTCHRASISGRFGASLKKGHKTQHALMRMIDYWALLCSMQQKEYTTKTVSAMELAAFVSANSQHPSFPIAVLPLLESGSRNSERKTETHREVLNGLQSTACSANLLYALYHPNTLCTERWWVQSLTMFVSHRRIDFGLRVGLGVLLGSQEQLHKLWLGLQGTLHQVCPGGCLCFKKPGKICLQIIDRHALWNFEGNFRPAA